jgi:hypothetical protein
MHGFAQPHAAVVREIPDGRRLWEPRGEGRPAHPAQVPSLTGHPVSLRNFPAAMADAE